MKPYTAAATALIKAAPSVIYGIVADYREAHQKILPQQYFVSLTVLEGGFGAGTRIRFQMKVFGSMKDFEAVITEPEPGRVLVESTLSGAVSTFRVYPVGDGKASQVTISTTAQTERDGLLGTIESKLGSSFLRRVYEKELLLLDALATKTP